MQLRLDGYKPGDDITLINCYYVYPTKNYEGKWEKDYICIIFRDNVTGKKHYRFIDEPEYEFYKIDDKFVTDYNQLFIEKEKVKAYRVKYRELEKEIAKLTGRLDEYKANIEHGERWNNRKLHTDPSIMMSDINIEDYYRFLFTQTYKNSPNIKINRAFFDIEVDTRYMAGSFVEMGECPINAISLHDERVDTIFTFILRDARNPLIEEFENKVKNNVISQKYIHDFVEKNLATSKDPGWKQIIRHKLDKTKFRLLFFDSEKDLLLSFFGVVHELSPDFIYGWNSSGFDLEYIIERIYALGYEPADIMCDSKWERGYVRHYIDKNNLNEFAERGDYTIITGDVVWMDQMIQFCSRRKSQIGSFTSFKLDDIGMKIAKVHKLSYSHITNNIAMLPWLNFEIFILYNIFDVIVQKCIENKTKDTEYVFSKCILNNTSYRKCHRQTIYLINRMTNSWFNDGLIIGNNCNRWNPEPTDKFAGAFVAKPTLVSDYAKMVVDKQYPIMVAENAQDNDYKSLYPSIALENNIAPNTQIGRIEIPEQVYAHENAVGHEKYTRSGEFIENLVTDNIIEFCHRWLYLADFEEMLMDMNEFFMEKRPHVFGPQYQMYESIQYGKMKPLYDTYEVPKGIYFLRAGEVPKGIHIYSNLSQNNLSSNFSDYKKGVV